MRGKPEFDKQNEYNRGKYDRIGLMLPKGKGEAWKAEASARGLSINAFVQRAVEFYLQNCTDESASHSDERPLR